MPIPRRLRRAGAVAVLALALPAVAVPAGAAGAAGGAPATGALRTAMRQLVAMAGGPPGAIAVVQRGGDRQAVAAGVVAVGSSRAPTAGDYVRIASVSKAFSGAAALALVARGRLSLGSTVGQILPTLPAAWGRVTLAELLNHTSGIPDFSASPGFQQAVAAAPTVAPPPRQLLGYVTGEPLAFTPGSSYAYSNSDNVIVALMTEAVTGQPYQAVLARYVFRPLGLTRTSLPAAVAMPRPFLHGYDTGATGPEDVSEVFAPGWAWASGGLVSTPGDTNRFVRGYVRGATTNRATRRRQFRFVPHASSEPPGPGANAAGLGVFRYRTACGTVYGHTGNTLGYTQFVAASGNGARSVSVTVSRQLSPKKEPGVFARLRRVFRLAVCAAMAR